MAPGKQNIISAIALANPLGRKLEQYTFSKVGDCSGKQKVKAMYST